MERTIADRRIGSALKRYVSTLDPRDYLKAIDWPTLRAALTKQKKGGFVSEDLILKVTGMVCVTVVLVAAIWGGLQMSPTAFLILLVVSLSFLFSLAAYGWSFDLLQFWSLSFVMVYSAYIAGRCA